MPMITMHAPATPTPTPAQNDAPGKFQGEPLYVGAYWDWAIEGAADYDFLDGDTLVSAFVVTGDDEAQWPELADCYAVAVWERGDGFVCSMRFDRAGFETWRRALEGAELNDDDAED